MKLRNVILKLYADTFAQDFDLVLQTIGMENNKERDMLKKNIKDLKSSLDRQKKQQEKEQKARERIEKQAAPKKKKFSFNK